MLNPDYSLVHVTGSICDTFSTMLYSWKYGIEDKYYKCLENLKNCMDGTLYRFFEVLGEQTNWKVRKCYGINSTTK